MLVSVVFSLVDHKNGTIKCSKLGEQSTFLLLWAVFSEQYASLWVVLYRFVLFWLILK